jgi:hypothetical protein
LGVSDNADTGRLAKHGIRVTEPSLMVNAFEDTDDNMNEFIQLQVSGDNKPCETNMLMGLSWDALCEPYLQGHEFASEVKQVPVPCVSLK